MRAKTKEDLRKKLYDLEIAQRMGLVLDDTTTVAELATVSTMNQIFECAVDNGFLLISC